MTLRTRAARGFMAAIDRPRRGPRVAPASPSSFARTAHRALASGIVRVDASDGAGWCATGPVALGAVAGLFGFTASVITAGTASGARCDAGGGPSEVANDSIVSARRLLREARVEERMRRESAGAPRPPRLPEPAVFLRDGVLVVRFTAPAPAPFPAADLAPLAVETIAALESSAGGKASSNDAKREYTVQAHSSDVAYQLLVTPRGAGKRSWIGRGGGDVADDSGVSALFAAPKAGGASSEVEFSKRGALTSADASVMVSAVSGGWLRAAENAATRVPPAGAGLGSGGSGGPPGRRSGGGGEPESESVDRLVTQLEGMGARVYLNDDGDGMDVKIKDGNVWGSLVGYEDQKREIEDTLLLALLHPNVYDGVASGTRKDAKGATNRPRALLFEGPPGTGKTSAAKAIAEHASVALIYVPLEAVASKYYGESERLLSQVFQLCDRLEGAVVFLDEVDALAQTRGGEMHEATRRLLSVLLRRIDGLDSRGRTVVVAATNRKQDLDPALVSRFDAAIEFGLPTEQCRGDIMGCYAKHLTREELATVAAATAGMSGRDLRDVAETTERRWASKIIRGVVGAGRKGAGRGGKQPLPPLEEYLASARSRRSTHV